MRTVSFFPSAARKSSARVACWPLLIQSICPCFVAGQAAGTAAALCVKGNVSPRNLPYPELRNALWKAKVFHG